MTTPAEPQLESGAARGEPRSPILHWLRYLVGHRQAIEQLAGDRRTFGVGALLVLITSVPRNYDQTYLPENPWLWIFAPLIFSFCSGTWLFWISYAPFEKTPQPGGPRPPFEEWRCFLGLFWMTAPIAWLYAIPVERWLDPIGATIANLILLGIVSVWRIFLMTRVLQVTTRTRYVRNLIWVLFATSVEVLIVYIFSPAFTGRILVGMGGMRYSPETELLNEVISAVFEIAFYLSLAALIFGVIIPSDGQKHRLRFSAPSMPGSIPWATIALFYVAWITLAIVPQKELANTHRVVELFSQGNGRAALDLLGQVGPNGFAPAHPLPPGSYLDRDLKSLVLGLANVRQSDPAWLKAHLLRRLDQSLFDMTHVRHWTWKGIHSIEDNGSDRYSLTYRASRPLEISQAIGGLLQISEGRTWLATNGTFLEELRRWVNNPPTNGLNSVASQDGWTSLSNQLAVITNSLSRSHPDPSSNSAPIRIP